MDTPIFPPHARLATIVFPMRASDSRVDPTTGGVGGAVALSSPIDPLVDSVGPCGSRYAGTFSSPSHSAWTSCYRVSICSVGTLG